MDYKGREGTQEALEKQNSCDEDLSNFKAHAGCFETEGSATRDLNRTSTLSCHAVSPRSGVESSVKTFRNFGKAVIVVLEVCCLCGQPPLMATPDRKSVV